VGGGAAEKRGGEERGTGKGLTSLNDDGNKVDYYFSCAQRRARRRRNQVFTMKTINSPLIVNLVLYVLNSETTPLVPFPQFFWTK
jgi:hypothetical protein